MLFIREVFLQSASRCRNSLRHEGWNGSGSRGPSFEAGIGIFAHREMGISADFFPGAGTLLYENDASSWDAQPSPATGSKKP